ncbi:uncharacterized protein BO97DRAFT_309947, partial [Aspergillus homomorphus CBS 101889]
MAPTTGLFLTRTLNSGRVSLEFAEQWKSPSDVFSVLLILGGDVVARALAQVSGSRLTPVAFSFGWVAYAVSAVVLTVGENRLMPPPDCSCKVINGLNGYARDNTSWILGRMVRDYESWMDGGMLEGPVHQRLARILNDSWEATKREQKQTHGEITRPRQAGLCVSVYRAVQTVPGHPGYDRVYFTGLATWLIQLGIAAIPYGLFGNWAILLVTGAGIFLAMITGALGQWKLEKWAGRPNRSAGKPVILTKGNGSQHAIVILSDKDLCLDLETLASGQANIDVSTSLLTRVTITVLAAMWTCLLITASAITHDTWFLLAIGGIGILQNVFTAGARRTPESFGFVLKFEEVIGHFKVMETLVQVEKKYPRTGKSMLPTFFPGELLPAEVKLW